MATIKAVLLLVVTILSTFYAPRALQQNSHFPTKTWHLRLAPSLISLLHCRIQGFPNSLDSKASACNAGDPGSIPGWGRSPGGGNGNLLQYFCLENSMERGARRATVHGVEEGWTRLSDQHTHCCIQQRDPRDRALRTSVPTLRCTREALQSDQSWLDSSHHLLAVRLSARILASLNLSFLICKMKIIKLLNVCKREW